MDTKGKKKFNPRNFLIWFTFFSSFPFNIFVQVIHYPERNSLLKFFFQKKLFFWPNIFQYIEVSETLIIFERIQYLRSSHSLSRVQFSIKILHKRNHFFFDSIYCDRDLWNSDKTKIWTNINIFFEAIHYPDHNFLLKFFFQNKPFFFFWLNISWSKSLKFFVQAIHYPERNSLLKFFLS